MIRISDLMIEAERSGVATDVKPHEDIQETRLKPNLLPENGGLSTGAKIALVGAGSVVVTIFVLFESGILGEWLRDKFYDPSKTNSEFLRKIITAGTLAHWKKSSGAVPVAQNYRDKSALLSPKGYRSLLDLYDTIALDGVLSVYRSGVNYGEIVNIKDYDLYETLVLEDDIGVRYYCIAYNDVLDLYVFRTSNGALVELRRSTPRVRADSRASFRSA